MPVCVGARNRACENVTVWRQDTGFWEELLDACVEAAAEFLAPVAGAVGEFGTEAERVVHGGLKDGAGNRIVFVCQSVEAESRGFERDGAAARHRVNDGDRSAKYLLGRGM